VFLGDAALPLIRPAGTVDRRHPGQFVEQPSDAATGASIQSSSRSSVTRRSLLSASRMISASRP
jgi:hypothetical protein